jgi:hypothetical protein
VIPILGQARHFHIGNYGKKNTKVFKFGVHGFTAFNGGDAHTVAEMRNYESIWRIVPELTHDRLAGKAMKSIALDTV